jgi:hypothetical protein
MTPKQIDFSKFYYLTESIKERGMEISTDGIKESEQNWDVFIGKLTPLKPIQVRLYKNGMRLDYHSFVETRLLSKNILDVLSRNNIKGWSTYPITLLDKKKQPIEGYVGLVVTGKCGPTLKEKRERKTKYDAEIDNIYSVYVGFYFDPITWDGSDIFSPEGTAVIIVTEKVKTAFEQAGITNVTFTPLTEVESLV